MVADFNKPTTASPYTTFPAEVRELFAALAMMMEGVTADNIPILAKRINATTRMLEQFNGTAWVDALLKAADSVLLDGQSGAFYRDASNIDAGTINTARLPAASTTAKGAVELATTAEAAGTSGSLAVTPAGLSAVFTAAAILEKLLTVDGTGTGLDADLLDGKHASAFALDGHEHVIADITDFPTLGTGDTDIPTVATVKGLSSKPHAPQSIVEALTGLRPDGWGPADCDAPVCSILADKILPHSTFYGQSGVASASGAYNSTLVAWRAVNGTVINDDDSWVSAIDTGISVAAPAWFRYDFHTTRILGATVTLIARSLVSDVANPKTFEIRGVRDDGSEDVIGSYTNQPLATPRQQLTYAITPLAPYKAAYLHITGSNALRAAAIGDFQISFADATNGHVGIPAGLKVAYADRGEVRLSKGLAEPLTVDLSSLADGTYYIAANVNADGSFAAPSVSAIQPEIGVSRVTAGADRYNPATITMLGSADAPIRRVYLGSVIKSGGNIVSVNCYALGNVVTLPFNNGLILPTNTIGYIKPPFVLGARGFNPLVGQTPASSITTPRDFYYSEVPRGHEWGIDIDGMLYLKRHDDTTYAKAEIWRGY